MKNVIIIDDDARNIFALSAILKTKSIHCTSYLDAREAIEELSENKQHVPDAILIDMMMPGMDGYEAIPLLKAIPHLNQVPIISVTALAMVGDREKCLNAGADHYVSKPVDVDKLYELLNA